MYKTNSLRVNMLCMFVLGKFRNISMIMFKLNAKNGNCKFCEFFMQFFIVDRTFEKKRYLRLTFQF